MSWAIWITGPPGSGKSAIARASAAALDGVGGRVRVLELDEVRKVLTPAPTYAPTEREVVYRCLVYVVSMLVEAGVPVIVDATAHRRAWRELARARVANFAEVELRCSLEMCRRREQARGPGHHPPGVYAAAGRPGATVPGVDVAYEPALAPELRVNTEVESVAAAAARVVELARQLEASAGPSPSASPGSAAIWLSGRPGSGKTALSRRVAEALRARGMRLKLLDLAGARRAALPEGPATAAGAEILCRAVVLTAKLLTQAGVLVIVDADVSRRAWREMARSQIRHFAEVELVCPPEICVERERASRWRLGVRLPGEGPTPAVAVAPDIGSDYEPSLRSELRLNTHVQALSSAVAEVVRLALRLHQRRGSSAGAGEETDMLVRELMTGAPIAVGPDTPVFEARQLMLNERIRHLLVMEGSLLVGIVTDRDIRLNLPSQATSLSVWEVNYLLAKLTVGKVMAKAVITVGPDRDAHDAARVMLEHRIGALPVVEGGRVLGILTETDILRAFVRSGRQPAGADG